MTTERVSWYRGMLLMYFLAMLLVGLAIVWFTILPTVTRVAIAVDTSISHGVERHGTSAVRVRECLNQKGALQEWVNPLTQRRARVCEVSPGVFGIQIVTEGDWKEITSFIKEKLRTPEQISQYLRNTGYQYIH